MQVKQEDKAQFADLFTEVFNAVDSKQLRPFVRTQYMRTAFQVRSSASSSAVFIMRACVSACPAPPMHVASKHPCCVMSKQACVRAARPGDTDEEP